MGKRKTCVRTNRDVLVLEKYLNENAEKIAEDSPVHLPVQFCQYIYIYMFL